MQLQQLDDHLQQPDDHLRIPHRLVDALGTRSLLPSEDGYLSEELVDFQAMTKMSILHLLKTLLSILWITTCRLTTPPCGPLLHGLTRTKS